MSWLKTLSEALRRFGCKDLGTMSGALGVQVQRLRPRHPLVVLSGCTPGPLYHSHPHKPEEFDAYFGGVEAWPTSMAAMVDNNIGTIDAIARSIQDNDELPFPFSGDLNFCRCPQIVSVCTIHHCRSSQSLLADLLDHSWRGSQS